MLVGGGRVMEGKEALDGMGRQRKNGMKGEGGGR